MQNCNNKELHFEDIAKGKYKRTHACLTMKTRLKKFCVLLRCVVPENIHTLYGVVLKRLTCHPPEFSIPGGFTVLPQPLEFS